MLLQSIPGFVLNNRNAFPLLGGLYAHELYNSGGNVLDRGIGQDLALLKALTEEEQRNGHVLRAFGAVGAIVSAMVGQDARSSLRHCASSAIPAVRAICEASWIKLYNYRYLAQFKVELFLHIHVFSALFVEYRSARL